MSACDTHKAFVKGRMNANEAYERTLPEHAQRKQGKIYTKQPYSKSVGHYEKIRRILLS